MMVIAMISIKVKGSFNRTSGFLKRLTKTDPYSILEKYAEQGLTALSDATPVDTGLTASSWSYEIKKENGVYSISWSNSNVQRGIRIAVILDTGHGTSNGGYVQGRNYIKPAIQPIFDKIADSAWKEVTNA